MDRGATTRLLDVVAARHRQGTTVVMISHHLALVAQYAQRVAVLRGGRLVALGAPRAILSDVEGLQNAGLEPLPITLLARQMGWPAPLPVSVDDWGRDV
jgi:energy-coupling factor transport system ATP-binding protein